MDGSLTDGKDFQAISAIVEKQRQSYLNEGFVSAEVRISRLKRALNILLDNQEAFTKSISDDFTHRSADTTLFADIVGSKHALKHAIDNVKKWMKADKRSLPFPLGFLGAKAEVQFQPKGVVGLITPWNFPLTMVFVPLAQMLAAGNRVVIKPSEHTPKTSALFAKVFGEAFDETVVAVYNGGVEVSQAFSSQRWNHLMFTGAPVVGKLIMRAASENLTPVTLELGGKSPVIVSRTADLQTVAERVATFKLMNAGQICLAPDYINIPAEKVKEFIEIYTKQVSKMYPSLVMNDDYTAIISSRHRERLTGYYADAIDKGGDVQIINPATENFGEQPNKANKMPPAIIADVSDDMKIMQEEIFGPILAVRGYENFEDVIDYVNDHERPLAIYYFGSDKIEEGKVLNNTTSGGVTINDALWHGAHETVPFGGVGNSGIGRYHGVDGFKEFSHHKSVVRHGKLPIGRILGIVPPYGKTLRNNMARELKK